MPRISVFARLANGNVAPSRVIEGQATKLSRTMHGIAYDEAADEIVIPVALGGALLVFRGAAEGEEAPVRVIQGSRTRLIRPQTVAVDARNGEILTADPSARAIFVYPREANGDVPPRRVITGPRTGLLDIGGVAVDPVRNVIVASSRDADGRTGLFVFDRLANGDVEPRAFIGGPRSGLGQFRQVAVDLLSGNIFVAQQRTRYKRADAYVLLEKREGLEEADRGERRAVRDSLSQTGFIGVYGPGDSGDIPPRAIIKGPGIRNAGAGGVAVNRRTGEVVAVGGNGVNVFLVPEFFGALGGRTGASNR